MVLKLRFAVSLAVLVGICTIFSGFGNAARPSTVLYRTAVSMFIFAIVGFGLGLLWERFLQSWLTRLNQTDEKEEEQTKEGIEGTESELTTEEADAEFDPLMPEHFENIAHPKE